MAKRYYLKRWHSSDSNPIIDSRGSLQEMREEMAAAVKGHEVSGLKPHKGFGNDLNRVTLRSTYHGPEARPWGIQYWIEEAPETLYNLLFVTDKEVSQPFTSLKEREVKTVLALVPVAELDRWRVSGDDSSYEGGRQWLEARVK